MSCGCMSHEGDVYHRMGVLWLLHDTRKRWDNLGSHIVIARIDLQFMT